MAINLLPRDLQQEQKQRSTQTIVSIVSVVVLVVFIAAAAVVFSLRVFVTRELDDVTANLNDVTRQVSEYRVVEGTLQSIQLKLKKADELLSKKQKFGDIVDEIQKKAEDLVSVTSVDMEESDKFSVRGEADALAKLADYIGKFHKEDSPYTELELENVSFNSTDFQYEFSLSFIYDKSNVSVEN